MSNNGKWVVKASVSLFLCVVISSSAEVVEGGFHVDGLGSSGRSFSNGSSGSNNLNNALSACNIGRAGAGAGYGAGLGSAVAPGVQGGAAIDGGILQASVPSRSVIPPASTASSSSDTPTPSNPALQLYTSKCKTCHDTNGISVTAEKAVAKLNNRSMPKRPITITDDERAQLVSFVQSGAIL